MEYIFDKQHYTLFLDLLSAAIWEKRPDTELYKSVDNNTWKEVIELAKKQYVIALIGESVQKLPKELKPVKQLLIPLLIAVESVEEANKKLNSELESITTEYRAMGLDFILLKGQGNAQFYPNPSHRSPGDIDLLFYNSENYRKSKEWVLAHDYPHEMEGAQHLSFHRNDIVIENHHQLTHLPRKKYNDFITKEIQSIVENNDFGELHIHELKIKTLPITLNAVYIFLHFFKHFIDLGIGFRQVCDWLIFLSKNKERIDKKEYSRIVSELDLEYAMQVFAQLSITYLGAPPDIFPFEVHISTKNKFVPLVTKDILQGGNFGFFHEKSVRDLDWHSRWIRYNTHIQRVATYYKLHSHFILPLPWKRMLYRIQLILGRE